MGGPSLLHCDVSAVGDAVHVLPVVNAIKRRPAVAHYVGAAARTGHAGGRSSAPWTRSSRFDRSRGWRAFTDVRDSFRGRQFDIVLALQDYFKAGILTAIAPAPVKLGYDRARARDANWLFTNSRIPPHAPHSTFRMSIFEFVSALGIEPVPLEWRLGPWDDERAWQREFATQVRTADRVTRHRHEPPAEGLDRRTMGRARGCAAAGASDFTGARWADARRARRRPSA